VVFVDLRGATTIGEARLPYDVLYLLNQFFHEMKTALTATNGHYSQFTGDGLMALYGLHESDPAKGAADALRGARAMLLGLDRLNGQLRNENSQPLKIGIGIHHSEAIVGAMGPPRSQIITAIGDTVNTCAPGEPDQASTTARSSCRARRRRRPASMSATASCTRCRSWAGWPRSSSMRWTRFPSCRTSGGSAIVPAALHPSIASTVMASLRSTHPTNTPRLPLGGERVGVKVFFEVVMGTAAPPIL
jgi:hypothetical protein